MENQTCSLTTKHCVPCEGGAPPLTEGHIAPLLAELSGWRVDAKQLVKEYAFQNFTEAVAFVNKVAEVAEGEGHHPDILVHDFKFVRLTLYTHAVGGLTENDFIVAAKVDAKKGSAGV